jgi:hypothetical protein
MVLPKYNVNVETIVSLLLFPMQIAEQIAVFPSNDKSILAFEALGSAACAACASKKQINKNVVTTDVTRLFITNHLLTFIHGFPCFAALQDKC